MKLRYTGTEFFGVRNPEKGEVIRFTPENNEGEVAQKDVESLLATGLFEVAYPIVDESEIDESSYEEFDETEEEDERNY